jgi:hypothetical protein
MAFLDDIGYIHVSDLMKYVADIRINFFAHIIGLLPLLFSFFFFLFCGGVMCGICPYTSYVTTVLYVTKSSFLFLLRSRDVVSL